MKKLLAITVVFIIAFASLFVLVGCADDNPNDTDKPPVDDANPMLLTEKQKVLNGAYGAEAQTGGSQNTFYGVGRTLNVITDDYITVSSGYGKVFDADKLLNLNWRKTFTGKMNADVSTGSKMQDFYKSFSRKINISNSAEVSFGCFSAGLDREFGFTTDSRYYETSNEIFYTASQIYAATLIEIDEYYNLSKFANVLSSDFLSDVQSVQVGDMSPEDFIYKYGTHVILAGYYGGRLDCNYYLRNMGEQWSNSTALTIENKIHATIGDIVNASQGVGVSLAEDLGIEKNEVIERFTATGIGGANFSSLSLSDFMANYSTWSKSMNDQTEYSNIVGLPSRSLAAIWDIIPSDYTNAIKKLSACFNKQAQQSSGEFLEKYKRHYTEKIIGGDDSGDTDNFNGGKGTEEKPYLISNETHFKNISNIDSQGKYFKLTDSINLDIWNEPFSFGGSLDGDKHSITFQQGLSGNIKFLGGLFTELTNESSVQNLRITANIKKDDGGTKEGYVGALAGITSGEVNVSRVSVDGKIHIGNYSGFNYVGGVFGKFVGGKISECSNSAEIKNYGKNVFSGGIIGYAIATDKSIKISNCYNTGNILASSNYTAAYGWRSGGGITGQVKGHDKNKLGIEYCYNDSVVKLEWTGVATGGWQGCGGILGDVRNGNHNNITVDYSYWNKTKNNYYGNNGVYHKNNGRKDMTGTYDRWSADIWIFSNSSAPALKWMQE